MWYTIIGLWTLMPNHQFSGLLSLLCHSFINAPEGLLFPDFLLNNFPQWICCILTQQSLLTELLAPVPLEHTTSHAFTHSDPFHSFLPGHLTRMSLSCCCHQAHFNCKVLLLWPVSSFPSSAIWDKEPIHPCPPATCSSTSACSSDFGMTVTSLVLYILLSRSPSSSTLPLSTWLLINWSNCYVTPHLGSRLWPPSGGH